MIGSRVMLRFAIDLEDEMKVSVYGTYNSVDEMDIKDRLVIVVDVLRATTTLVTSLNNGCKEVIPVVEIEEAMEIAKNYDRETYLLAGERNALKIEGFDLSNSPAEYLREVVENKSIIFTSTNGTRAIRKAEGAREVILGALINAKAVGNYISGFRGDIAFICAGTDGRFSLDDILTAGAIINRLKDSKSLLELDDLATVCEYMYREHRGNLRSIMEGARHYNILKSTKHCGDIDYCLKEDIISVVPKYKGGVLRLK